MQLTYDIRPRVKLRKKLLLILLLVVSSVGFSDANDSAFVAISRMPEDTAKVDALISLAKQQINQDSVKAQFAIEDASKLSDKLGYIRGKALVDKLRGIISYNHGDYIKTINYWTSSLESFELINDSTGIANLLCNIGAMYFDQGDDANALDYYLRSRRIAESIHDTLRLLTLYVNIGGVYQNKPSTYDLALKSFKAALPLAEVVDDNDNRGTLNLNIGEIYFNRGQIDSALYYYELSTRFTKETEDYNNSLVKLAEVYLAKKDYPKAISFVEEACRNAEKMNSQRDMAISLIMKARVFSAIGDNKTALTCLLDAEKIAAEIGADYQLKDAYSYTSAEYAKIGDYARAYQYHEKLLALNDKLFNLDIQKKLGTLQFSFDIEKKEAAINLLTKDQELKQQEIKRQKMVRNSFIGGFAIMLLFAGVFFLQRNRISKEKKRSDELLLNILPEETAEELKATGTAQAKSFDLVTVMFTDFKNFTQASERLTPQELVNEINYCYSEFDRIIVRYGIEKIKTIGDAYMCAGGLPVANDTNPQDVVKAGLEMQQFMWEYKQDRIAKGHPFFELRLGIHTGPVVAGIVGIKKFAYDIWGDTVNTASRMESSGEIGKVNISGTTYELVKQQFVCAHRGKVPAKNKGEIDMYFVERIA